MQLFEVMCCKLVDVLWLQITLQTLDQRELISRIPEGSHRLLVCLIRCSRHVTDLRSESLSREAFKYAGQSWRDIVVSVSRGRLHTCAVEVLTIGCLLSRHNAFQSARAPIAVLDYSQLVATPSPEMGD